MPFDIKSARPVSSSMASVIPVPEDPVKAATSRQDLVLKYLEATAKRQANAAAAAKANKKEPTYGQVAGGQAAKAEGRAIGAQRAAARQSLPAYVRAAKANSQKLQQLLDHEGFSALVGRPNPFKGGFGVGTLPLSSARGASSLFQQIKGTAFLTGVQAMKGTGPVSEREGLAAEKAIQRMSTSLSENEFKLAAQEYIDAMARGVAALQEQATMAASTPVAAPLGSSDTED
jgi:hypothetical protein